MNEIANWQNVFIPNQPTITKMFRSRHVNSPISIQNDGFTIPKAKLVSVNKGNKILVQSVEMTCFHIHSIHHHSRSHWNLMLFLSNYSHTPIPIHCLDKYVFVQRHPDQCHSNKNLSADFYYGNNISWMLFQLVS